jgi:hypothetical protein
MEIEWEDEDDEGNEIVFSLPACWAICDNCDGHGQHMTPGLRDHAFSAGEFYEEFPFPEDREAYFGGGYDVCCDVCNGSGKRRVVDRDQIAARKDPREMELLDRYDDMLADRAAYLREVEMERKYGA